MIIITIIKMSDGGYCPAFSGSVSLYKKINYTRYYIVVIKDCPGSGTAAFSKAAFFLTCFCV